MPTFTQLEKLRHGIAHHQAGRLAEAEGLYREILAHDPGCVDALHYLGVIAHQVGWHGVAVELIGRAAILGPKDAAIHYNLGSAYLQSARLAEAVASFQRALALQPSFPSALNSLGQALAGLGRLDEAVASVRRAIALKPDFANAYNSLGNICRDRGQTGEAIDAYRKAVALKPDFAEALNNLGNALIVLGRFDDADDCYRRALVLQPHSAAAHNNLGNLLRERGRFDEAVPCYRQAIALKPDFAEAHNNLGNVLLVQCRYEEAEACFRQALVHQPNLAEAQNHLGNVLAALGRVDEAIDSYRQALAFRPNFAKAHNNLGIALTQQGRFDEALVCMRQALALQPDLADAHNNLGNLFRERGQLDEALACIEQAIALKPDFAAAYNNLAGVLKDRGQLDQAIVTYRRALKLQPDYAEAHSNLILALHYSSGDQPAVIHEELRRWHGLHARPLAGRSQSHPNDRTPDRRLRIGYVSPDFRSHPVGRFLLPLFAARDRQACELFCYSAAPRPDRVTAQLRAHADGWRDLAGQSDRQVADLIRLDRIDILVDLALHTARNRLAVFAYKPAPVQATYLAYPGGSGLDTIDYRITDPHLDPLDSDFLPGTEVPFRLPQTYWCYQPSVDSLADVSQPPVHSAGFVTFGCLNNFCKVTAATLSAWSRLLVEVPGSRLCLHVKPGSHRERLRDFFAGHTIDLRRLEFIDHVPAARYFQTYQSIDIGLDPFPFPGGTTTCDALWMGVPVISLAGPTSLSRGGLSVLTNAGLSELIAHSVDEYVERAVGLAQDLPRLSVLRASLRERLRSSPLMDAPRFARDLENAYRVMWHRWCAQPPVDRG
ncbi:MAG: tetratricopeptide repeat protein [Verrucomicrobia bacterium]|nr:tetratricopeptide repeat protein [Verrucomicrobiota bacterium]